MRSTRQKMIHSLGFGLIALGVFSVAFGMSRLFLAPDIYVAESAIVPTSFDPQFFAQANVSDKQLTGRAIYEMRSPEFLACVVTNLDHEKSQADSQESRSPRDFHESVRLLSRKISFHFSKAVPLNPDAASSPLIYISASGRNPQEATETANQVAKFYCNYTLARMDKAIEAINTAYRKTLEQIEGQVRDAELRTDRLRPPPGDRAPGVSTSEAQRQQYAAYWNERNKLDDARKARDAVHLRMTQEIVDAKLDTFNGTKWECSLADTPLRPSRQYLVVALGLLCFGIIVSIQGLGLLAKAKHISAK